MMGLRFGSVCSGIEAASVAWHPLGWRAAFVSEIDRFPCAVLTHHYPDVPNLGDMTKFKEWPDAAIDVLVGGTPCQSFSVAGLRKGLADPRGNLMLTYLGIAARYRPTWLVWENVPGVLSSNGGRDFGAMLGGLAELGYGFAYRVLDAQYFGLAQRRKRVFVVGCLGDWRRAAAVLFERESLSGHPAPSRKARQVAPTIPARSLGGGGLGTDFDCDGGLIATELARCDATREGSSQDYESTTMVAHALRADGFDASEDGTGRGTPLVSVGVDVFNGQITGDVAATLGARGSSQNSSGPTLMAFHNRQDPDVSGDVTHPLGAQDNGMGIAFDTTQITSKANRSNPQPDDPCHPLAAKAHPPAVAFDLRGREHGAQFEGPHETANLRAASGGSSRSYVQQMQVRRLTPRECERLQGFPDDYTLIQYRNKPAADGPRYKALGNSMAVPCMHWIGKRIQRVNEIGGEQ